MSDVLKNLSWTAQSFPGELFLIPEAGTNLLGLFQILRSPEEQK